MNPDRETTIRRYRARIAKGVCPYHPDRPLETRSRCAQCAERDRMKREPKGGDAARYGSRKANRERWQKVDWSLPYAEITRLTGKTEPAVRAQHLKFLIRLTASTV